MQQPQRPRSQSLGQELPAELQPALIAIDPDRLGAPLQKRLEHAGLGAADLEYARAPRSIGPDCSTNG
jgi:hypothetical protein